MAKINIHTSIAATDMKEDYIKICSSFSMNLGKYLGAIVEGALNNQDVFSRPLTNVRPGGGKHISITVSDQVKTDFKTWAKSQGSDNAKWCNHILQKALELSYLPGQHGVVFDGGIDIRKVKHLTENLKS